MIWKVSTKSGAKYLVRVVAGRLRGARVEPEAAPEDRYLAVTREKLNVLVEREVKKYRPDGEYVVLLDDDSQPIMRLRPLRLQKGLYLWSPRSRSTSIQAIEEVQF